MAQSSGCEQFQVGTKQWTDCVHGQATGGGLMPWIVVIPLGVMVIGMMIGFAYQFSATGRRRAKAHGAAGTAGTWLIFISFIELAIGTGSWVGAKRAAGEGGGYDTSAMVLLTVGAVLFVVGVYLKIRGRRRARIFHNGVPGEAVIRAVHETGTMVNNQPMYAFDLDVTGQGFAPVSTSRREVIPFWFLNRVGPQSRVPVKVDPSNPTRVIFDWDRFAMTTPAAGTDAPMSTSFGGGTAGGTAQGMVPSADSLADAMQAARDLTGRVGSGWHAGKLIGIAITFFVLLVVGGGLVFVAKIFGEVSGAMDDATGQVAEAVDQAGEAFEGVGKGGGTAAATTVEVTRTAPGREPLTIAVSLPVGWIDVTSMVPEKQGPILVDLVTKPQTPSEARIVVTRSVHYMKNPSPPVADVSSIRSGIEREFGDTLVGSKLVRLGGEEALELEIAPGVDGLQTRQVAVMRDGQLLYVSVTAPKSEWRPMLAVFNRLLASWEWGSVSA